MIEAKPHSAPRRAEVKCEVVLIRMVIIYLYGTSDDVISYERLWNWRLVTDLINADFI
jgi:hypothetical protein